MLGEGVHTKQVTHGMTSVTRHIRRTRRIRRAAVAQLPEGVPAPALDTTPAHNRARVSISQGDGDGGDACVEKY